MSVVITISTWNVLGKAFVTDQLANVSALRDLKAKPAPELLVLMIALVMGDVTTSRILDMGPPGMTGSIHPPPTPS
jgi:hypothetical protein